VTNKTTGKPSSGDTVVLIDVQAGMGEAAHATTDANGKYSLNEPGAGPYLIRATHQGATYFIGAPQGNAPGEITVYDAAAKVEGIALNADVIEFETGNGKLFVNERYFVKNASTPPRTQNGPHGFEVVIPADAVLDGAAATRPGGLPTNAQPEPAGQKGHFFINVPIQPSLGEKDTLFDLRYHLPYSGGKYVFTAKETLAADNIAVLLPKSMTFTPGKESGFQPIQEDPALLTFVVKNAPAGKAISFTISGEGSMPRENQGTPAAQQPTMGGAADAGTADAGTPGNQPGGGIGAPIATPDPLTKYKWWILAGLALLLVAAAAFLLRKPVSVSKSLGERYQDGYRVAGFMVLMGSITKIASLAIGAVILIVALTAGKVGGDLGVGVGIISAVLTALTGFAMGVLISAQGQIMQSMIDTAVNTSPLIDNTEKAHLIGVTAPNSEPPSNK
jgi:hypothetical protein